MAQHVDVHSEIAAANKSFIEAFKNGDAAALAGLYTADAQLLSPARECLAGRQAIQAFWQGLFLMGMTEAKLETLEIEARGETAIEVSKLTVQGGGGELLERGKYVVVWKIENGSWKLHRDAYNSGGPAAVRRHNRPCHVPSEGLPCTNEG